MATLLSNQQIDLLNKHLVDAQTSKEKSSKFVPNKESFTVNTITSMINQVKHMRDTYGLYRAYIIFANKDLGDIECPKYSLYQYDRLFDYDTFKDFFIRKGYVVRLIDTECGKTYNDVLSGRMKMIYVSWE